jgi:hypothetical protein
LQQSFASLLANDSDPDGDALTISSASSSYGNAYASGGSVFFTPYPNVTGSASFNYTVSDGRGGMIEETARVDVMSTNRAPVITNVTATATPTDSTSAPIYFTWSVTASDPDGDPISLNVVQEPAPSSVITFADASGFFWIPGIHPMMATIKIDATDSKGAHSNVITVTANRTYTTPIVLDLAGNGLNLLSSTESGITADVLNSAATGTLAWAGAGNAFLALDDDGDGIINAQDIIFTDDAPGAETDMDAVQQVYDTSGSGTLDQADTRFADFRVWEDRNQDGIADQAEVQTLAEAGIASVGLTGARDDQSVNGSIVHRTTEFTRTDGTVGTAADVSLGTLTVTTSIETAPTVVSTSTVLHSLPNAVPVVATQAQAVTVTTVVTAPTAVTSQATILAPVQTQQVSQTEAAPSVVSTALPQVQTTAQTVTVATSSVPADTANTISTVTVAASPEVQTASAVTETANQTTAISSSAASTALTVAQVTSGATGVDTPAAPTETVTTAALPEAPTVTTAGSPTSSSAATPVTTSSVDTTGSAAQTPTDTPAATTAAAPPAPVAATDTAPPASTSVDLTANIANQADLLRQAMAAFDPAPSVAAAASATDMLTQTATLAAHPISAGDQGETKLAA